MDLAIAGLLQVFAQISSIEAGNAWLPAFVERFNESFAVSPTQPDDLHRKVNPPSSRLSDILCRREQRYVGAWLTFHCDRKQIILEPNATSGEQADKYVELYEYTGGQLEVRWKGTSLPYRIFSNDRHVSHAAIVENKRLGRAMAMEKRNRI